MPFLALKRPVFKLGEVIVHSPSLWRLWYILLRKCISDKKIFNTTGITRAFWCFVIKPMGYKGLRRRSSSSSVGGPFIISPPSTVQLPWGRLFKLPQNCSWLPPFSLICRRQDARAIYRTSQGLTSQPAGKNVTYFFKKNLFSSFPIHNLVGFFLRLHELGFARGGLVCCLTNKSCSL